MRSSIILLCAATIVVLYAAVLTDPVKAEDIPVLSWSVERDRPEGENHAATTAEDIRILSWNVESDRPEGSGHFADGNSPAMIAAELTALQQTRGPYDLIALTEVLADNASIYESAAEATGRDYVRFVSATGGSDRMVILVDEARFTVDGGDAVELESHENITFPGGSARRPLFVQLEDMENNGLEFIFIVNHLTRGNEDNRRIQAEGLRGWAEDQTLPVIAAGDYNFDFNFRNLTGNQAMSIFLDDEDDGDSTWDWVPANTLIEIIGTGADQRTMVVASFVDTNWSDGNEQIAADQRVDSFPGSLLDFVFVAQGAREWPAQSRVIVRENDFPDTADTSDHRPIEATFHPTGN